MLTRLGGRLRRRDERGAFVVLAAVTMVAMLAMAAVAIDLSNARQQRRLSQASADAAALAAAQDLPDATKVVATAKEYAARNFEVTDADWLGCTDEDHLPETPDAANANTCISIDEAFGQVRVRIPTRQVDTFFAGAVGVDQIGVASAATAQARLRKDDRIIPATVAASSGSGNICIENGGANVAPCDKETKGNFGSFHAPRISLHVPTSSFEDNSLRINYSMGVDHVLSIYGTGSTKVCDHAHPVKSPCTTTNVASALEANHLLPFTGNAVPPLTEGLVDNATISTDSGNKLFCGRLRRPDLTPDNLAVTDPAGCNHWAGPSYGPGPRVQVLDEWINGRHVSYWMKSDFRTQFYPGRDPVTQSVTAPGWTAGDTRLACFMESYRFDYGGTNSKGHVAQTEFFIDPAGPIDPLTADGPEFTLEQARAYLIGTCGLDATFVNTKLASLTDGERFWPMFDKEAITDPRFGMIPVVKNFGSGGSTPMQVVRFWAIYLYRLHSSPQKVQAVDAWVFEPALIETESGIADLQFGYQPDEPIVSLVE